MKKVLFDDSAAKTFISADEIKNMEKLVLTAKEELVTKTGAGNDFLGWIELPSKYNKAEFARIKKTQYQTNQN